jgi:hypothetical protein
MQKISDPSPLQTVSGVPEQSETLEAVETAGSTEIQPQEPAPNEAEIKELQAQLLVKDTSIQSLQDELSKLTIQEVLS